MHGPSPGRESGGRSLPEVDAFVVNKHPKMNHFYAPQLYRQVLLRARIIAMAILSVRLSITTRYGFKARSDRDSGSSPCDSLESVVSYEVIWCHWVKRFYWNEGIKRGTPSEIVILQLLPHLA